MTNPTAPRLSDREPVGFTTVNSPDRFDLTYRFGRWARSTATTPVMLAMVAVGAMAMQLELRIPSLSPCDARRPSPGYDDLSTSNVLLAALRRSNCSVSPAGRCPGSKVSPRKVWSRHARSSASSLEAWIGVVADRFHRAVGEIDRRSNRRDVLHCTGILETHDAQSPRDGAQVGVTCLTE